MATLQDYMQAGQQGGLFDSPGRTLKDAIGYKEPKTWQKIVGILGDALTSYGGGQPTFMPNWQRQRQQAQETEQAYNLAEMKGNQDIQRFQAQKQYERDNPAPTDLEIYMKRAGIDPNSEQGQSMFRSKAENTANPPVWRQGPDMQFYRVDTPGGAPTKPVGRLTPIAEAAPSQYTPQPDVVKQAYIDMYGPQRGAQMYDELIGGR